MIEGRRWLCLSRFHAGCWELSDSQHTDILIEQRQKVSFSDREPGRREKALCHGAHLFHKKVCNSLVEDHFLLSSLRLESINTVFHKGEGERRYICLPVCQVSKTFHPCSFMRNILCHYSEVGRWPCQPAFLRVYTRHQEVSD